MPIPRKPYSEWKEEDLRALVNDPPAQESAHLDFKRDCNIHHEDAIPRQKARRDLLVDVASFANGDGGALILGVEESQGPGGIPFAFEIVGVESPGTLQQSIDDLVFSRLDVRPAALRYHPVPCQGDRHVLVVEVPANTYSLSMITYQCNAFGQFWARIGTSNRLMKVDEIESKIGQFSRVFESAESELTLIREELTQAVGSPIVWFVGVPVGRSRDHIPVDLDRAINLIGQSSYYGDFPRRRDRRCRLPLRLADRMEPYLHGMRIPRDGDGPPLLVMQRNGVLVYAEDLTARENTEIHARGSGGVVPWIVQAWNIYEPILCGLYLFNDLQRHYGVSASGLVQAGFVSSGMTGVCSRGPGEELSVPVFSSASITLDRLHTHDEWRPKEVFKTWVRQIANDLKMEHPLQRPPWVPESST